MGAGDWSQSSHIERKDRATVLGACQGAARARGSHSCMSRSCCGGEKNKTGDPEPKTACMCICMNMYIHVYVLLFVVQLLN